MKAQENEIIEKAAGIIENSGVEELTVHNLADKLQIKESQLYQQLTNDEDIYLLLLLNLENDIVNLLKGIEQSDSPESQLKILFKKLYFFFIQKPYYLDIIFDKNLKNRDKRFMDTFLRIRKLAKNYLTEVINKGKTENTFKTRVPTSVLAGKILTDFRTFMKDEQRFHEVILEMKKLQTSKE